MSFKDSDYQAFLERLNVPASTTAGADLTMGVTNEVAQLESESTDATKITPLIEHLRHVRQAADEARQQQKHQQRAVLATNTPSSTAVLNPRSITGQPQIMKRTPKDSLLVPVPDPVTPPVTPLVGGAQKTAGVLTPQASKSSSTKSSKNVKLPQAKILKPQGSNAAIQASSKDSSPGKEHKSKRHTHSSLAVASNEDVSTPTGQNNTSRNPQIQSIKPDAPYMKGAGPASAQNKPQSFPENSPAFLSKNPHHPKPATLNHKIGGENGPTSEGGISFKGKQKSGKMNNHQKKNLEGIPHADHSNGGRGGKSGAGGTAGPSRKVSSALGSFHDQQDNDRKDLAGKKLVNQKDGNIGIKKSVAAGGGQIVSGSGDHQVDTAGARRRLGMALAGITTGRGAALGGGRMVDRRSKGDCREDQVGGGGETTQTG